MSDSIRNSKGDVITLTAQEQLSVNFYERLANALGFKIDITSLTQVLKQVSEQRFFLIAPADYMPVKVGEGSWASYLTKYRSFVAGDDFATGIINMSSNQGRLASVNAGVDSVAIPVIDWAKSIEWTRFEVEKASRSGNWDLIASLEKSRKMNWDLGLQKLAFLGIDTHLGLLNQASSDVTPDTAIFAGNNISTMSDVEFQTLCAQLYDGFRARCNRTAVPTHFIMPEKDFNAIAAPATANFPIKSRLQLLEETFARLTMNKAFKILPCAYCDSDYSGLKTGGDATDRYVLLNYDSDSLAMNVPLDYNSSRQALIHILH